MTVAPHIVLRGLLNTNDNDVMVFVDSKHEGTEGLPDFLQAVANDGIIPLRIITHGPNPVTDLDIQPDGWSATLSFNRVERHVYVPWGAVVGFRIQGYLVQLLLAEHDIPIRVAARTEEQPKLRVVK